MMRPLVVYKDGRESIVVVTRFLHGLVMDIVSVLIFASVIW